MRSKIDWKQVQVCYDDGLTINELSKKFQISIVSIYEARKRGDLVLIPFRDSEPYNRYDYKKLQEDYDNGLSTRELTEKYGIAWPTLYKASKKGKFKLRNKSEAGKMLFKVHGPRHHSEETKNKISKIRLEYLEKHPDKVPYIINHSSKKSYPEQIFESALNSANITGWNYHYRCGIYQYDFAFPEKKIDVEIDGSTHLSEKVKKIDARRDEYSKKHGWTVIRFAAEDVKLDVISCIEKLKLIL